MRNQEEEEAQQQQVAGNGHPCRGTRCLFMRKGGAVRCRHSESRCFMASATCPSGSLCVWHLSQMCVWHLSQMPNQQLHLWLQDRVAEMGWRRVVGVVAAARVGS